MSKAILLCVTVQNADDVLKLNRLSGNHVTFNHRHTESSKKVVPHFIFVITS